VTAGSTEATRRAAAEVARMSYGRLVAYLASVTGDVAAAEDALSDAFLAALRTWPERGVPQRPDAWLVTAARRSLIDAARRRAVAARGLPEIARLLDERAGAAGQGGIPDKRLELMFACTHPAIDPAMRSPLMLQTVLGLDAARIASAFLVAPSTMGQRLVRVKAKIKDAGVPMRVPEPPELAERVGSVLDAIYAAYSTGWDDLDTGTPPGGNAPDAVHGLVAESIRLARLVTELLPEEPEALGLLALVLHSNARAAARRTADGSFVPLDEQDVGRWSRSEIAQAEACLSAALRLRDARIGWRIGPYQLHAAIQSVHNRRAVTGRTDWAAIAGLYDGLVAVTPTIGAVVALAKARCQTDGPVAGLRLLDDLPADRIATYQPYWVVRAHCLRLAGDPLTGAAAVRAIELTADPGVRRFLAAQYGTAG
jgi:RNA polymerase sigma-70 factor (ECF subfamily)